MELFKRYNKKMGQDDESGAYKLRVFHKKGEGVKCPRLLIKCGCCDNELKIYYCQEGLEINGVNASIEEWKNILQPLLNMG